MNKKQLVEKVKKLLALAGNNPNENEAQAAMLKAQKMIAEYNLEITDVEEKDAIVIKQAQHPGNRGFRTQLAVILAENFRCKAFMTNGIVTFIGYEADVNVCTEVFNYAYKVACKNARKIKHDYQLAGYSITGVKNSYFFGFCAGIKEVLDQQCRALMIVTPQEVVDALKSRINGGTYRGGMKSTAYDPYSEQMGRCDGKAVMHSRQIE